MYTRRFDGSIRQALRQALMSARVEFWDVKCFLRDLPPKKASHSLATVISANGRSIKLLWGSLAPGATAAQFVGYRSLKANGKSWRYHPGVVAMTLGADRPASTRRDYTYIYLNSSVRLDYDLEHHSTATTGATGLAQPLLTSHRPSSTWT